MQPVKTKKKLSRADKKQIEAAIARTDTGWQVTLVHAADGQKAEALLAANCGTIPYEITAGGTAP